MALTRRVSIMDAIGMPFHPFGKLMSDTSRLTEGARTETRIQRRQPGRTPHMGNADDLTDVIFGAITAYLDRYPETPGSAVEEALETLLSIYETEA